MSDEKLPVAIESTEIEALGVKVMCLVLDDGRRMFEQKSMDRLVAAMGAGRKPDQGLDRLKAWAAGIAN